MTFRYTDGSSWLNSTRSICDFLKRIRGFKFSMIVYGEILFVENFIIGSVLLYITADIFGICLIGLGKKLRLLAGGAMCGLFSLEIFLNIPMAVTLALEICFAFFVVRVVFGRENLLKKALTMILVTYFMGGITMGLLLATKNPGIYTAAGIYTGDMKAAMLALFIAIGLFTAKQIIKTISKAKFYSEHIFSVKVTICGKVFEVKGFFDSGNQLADPLKGNPVVVADERLWRLLDKAEVLEARRMGIVPYESVGAKGILMSVRTDHIEVAGRRFNETIVARGADEFGIWGNAEECQLLLSRNMMRGNI